MTYAISDIHGNYAKYIRLLQTINLCPAATFYILGDVVDRGPEPMKILLDIMSRPNVVPILGNHELTAAYCLRFLLKEITDDTFGDIRAYCSRIDKISICMLKTAAYQNYHFIKDVPHDYDRYYLYGFGMIESAFEDEGETRLDRCLEFVLTDEPRKDL